MQLDMFGATEETTVNNTAPPIIINDAWLPPELIRFEEALGRRDLGSAIRQLNTLKTDAAARVLLGAGFAISSLKNRAQLMASVQRDIVEAARCGVNGHALRLSESSDSALANDNETLTNHILEKEFENHGRTISTERISSGVSRPDRTFGSHSGIDRQQMATGMAEASRQAGEHANVPDMHPDTIGAGDGSHGSRAESAASVPTRDPRDLRDSGSPADRINPVTERLVDYVLSDEDLIDLGSLGEKFRNNIQAIEIVKKLETEQRRVAPDEQKILARYVGWGGLKGVFDANNKQWSKQHNALKNLLTDSEWAAASRSQLDAFYTSPVIANAMYSAVTRLGFGSGRILEPSVGVGNFFGLMPETMRRDSVLHGVELDVLSSQIVASLYPNAKIAKATGFQDFKIPAGYFDMVIGNPPFGSQAVTDDSGSAYSGWSIHNYFFAKSIDMLRPGGVMPMVVSHHFLDKLDPHVRQWISRRAELISGVRLPKTAFKENANTEVVTDILIFRRLDDSAMSGRQALPNWLNVTDVNLENPETGGMTQTPINDYFLENPHNVLGTQHAASGLYRGNAYTVNPNGNLADQLANWVEELPANIYVPLVRSAVELDSPDVAIPDGVKEGSYYLDENIIHQRLPDMLGNHRSTAWEPPNQRAFERMSGMIHIRETMRHQMRLERSSDATDDQIEDGRKALNRIYNDFQRKNGFLNDATNRRLFMDDTESALIQALEFDYEKAISATKAAELGLESRPARATKADILHRRVLFPPVEIANVETAKDALLHALNMTGRVDMEYMQRAYGKDREAIISELGDLVFNDPIDGLMTADAYLTGDVKSRFEEAEAAAVNDPAFLRNVEALSSVIPKDKLPSEIFASIGAAWIPGSVYSDFAEEISGGSVLFGYVKGVANWASHVSGGIDFAKNNNAFGTERMSALDILSQTMNSRAIEVKKKVMLDGKERYVTDEAATEAARQKCDKIRGHWDSWLWSDGDRADELTNIYNKQFNRIVGRRFDGSHLTFPGMNPAISLLAHQKNTVWRALQDRTLLADQVVGAGKTYELVTIAMEMRRLGIAKKMMLAVPNHLTLQWRSDFYRLYPGANILAATPQDFDKDNREKFFSKIVTGNWDAIIIGHSSLKKLGVPLDAENAILQEQFDEISSSIRAMKEERGDRNIIRDMEKIKGNLQAKINTLNKKAGHKDNVVNFEDLGVDALAIDELHEFKNLFFSTQMSRVAGLGNPAGSGKAFDLFVKIRWLKKTYGENAPLITATGTPVSNSLAEMYTMQRFMQYESLKRDGLHHFDTWAKQYGDVQTVYEVAPSGNGYRLSQRFAKFKNLASLMGSYRSFADVVTLEDLKAQEIALGRIFPVPKMRGGRPQNIVAKRSDLQEKFFGVPEIQKDENARPRFDMDLSQPVSITQQAEGNWKLESLGCVRIFETEEEAAYALAIMATTPKMTIDPKSIVGQFENIRHLTRATKGKINALSLTGLANKAGLDYRLIDTGAADFGGSKINLAIGNMLTSYAAWQADKGVQLVFCDLSIPLSAKAKMASNEKRIYVRNDQEHVTHKKGTLHTVKDYEGFPYYLVAEGKGKGRTYTLYDPGSGQVLKSGFDSKISAHTFVSEFIAKEGGQEQWLDIRESARMIEEDEIDEYKNSLALDDEGDSADFEISAKDIEGATGVSGFSVYDDIKAKLIARGVPENEVEFIHDHDTPQAKDALFKRVNAGDVRFLLGSTPKMGAGTNVQKRLVALHHIDAPWRPSDLEQREGRIIRRGNLLYDRDPAGFFVEVNRYATAQTYDTRRWQLLEHKAAGVDQLRNYKGDNEIEDVASEAANSADMKAAASGNPLILRETQLSNEVKKLRTLARAHNDSEFMLRNRLKSFVDYAERSGPAELAKLTDLLQSRNLAKTLAVYEGKVLHENSMMTTAMGKIAVAMNEMGASRNIHYRGLLFAFEKVWETKVTMMMPDGDKHLIEALSPSGAVTRMENWANAIEQKIHSVNNRIDKYVSEAEGTRKLLGQPFNDADALAGAISEHGKVQRALMKANSSAAIKPEEKVMFAAALAEQKRMLISLGYATAVAEIEAADRAEEINLPNAEVIETASQIATVNTGLHIGEIIRVEPNMVIQSCGRGQEIAHLIAPLDVVPELGQAVKIAYAGGKGVVRQSGTQEREVMR
ncbi:Eco57I restriction-modification methylase domain-containing protein [Glaciimonas sp. GG7]